MITNTLCLLLFAFALFGSASHGWAEVVIATETARGEYEKGVFSPGKAEFRYRFEIDEKEGTARLSEVIRLKDDSITELGTDYVITAKEDGKAMSGLLISKDRQNQRILTLVGKPGSLATEVILLGENFFEYCKASSGRLYIASGLVKRSTPLDEDIPMKLNK
jgi:hypothetical protein